MTTTYAMSSVDRFRWIEVRNFSAVLRKGGRALALSIFEADGSWNAVAIETPAKAALGGIERVLDDHGHLVLGQGVSLRKAKVLCRDFAKKWIRVRRVKKCDCKEIRKPA